MHQYELADPVYATFEGDIFMYSWTKQIKIKISVLKLR